VPTSFLFRSAKYYFVTFAAARQLLVRKGPSIGKIFHHPGDPPAKTDTEVMRTRNGRCSTDILNVEIH